MADGPDQPAPNPRTVGGVGPNERPVQSASAKTGSSRFMPGGRMNTLGLNRRDLDEFLDQVDAAPAAGSASRTFVRRQFRHIRIPMQVAQPGGSVGTFPVACRNVSRGGVSVLHNAYLHVGTRCTFALPSAAGGYSTVHGRVVRCQHRRGMIHEIGVKFDSLIDLRPLLGLDIFSDWYSRERLEPTDLKGTLLYVETSAPDRKMVRYHLRDTGLSVVTADDSAQGLEKAATGADVVLCGIERVDQAAGVSVFVQALRAAGVKGPVLVLTSDTGTPMREALAATAAQAFLAKPVGQELLIRAIGEFLAPAPDAKPAPKQPENTDSAKPAPAIAVEPPLRAPGDPPPAPEKTAA